jgi:hypothetical protein
VTTGIGFNAFASAPQNKNFRTEFCAKVHRTHRFLQRIGAHFRIVRGERSVPEDRMKK